MAMTTRNTARRVLRSDTAPARRLLELENGDADTRALTPTPDQQLETALTGVRLEMTALHDDLRQKVSTSLTRISTEMQELQGNLANLVQGMTNMLTTLIKHTQWLKPRSKWLQMPETVPIINLRAFRHLRELGRK
ncbi:unnamed protein product [Phytophthora lilii]|uniref:Unnamed protein product n=1 Tax=Phytophthora lilii TaxID=2077276 RepID=A0A9W6X0H9_9STRA|nr:unnamed protein product [Phytophthora lilii]